MCELIINDDSINIKQLFHDVYNELITLHENRIINFTVHELHTINGDHVLIRLLITNILSNALKCTQTKEKTLIEVSCSKYDHEYIIEVKDNGVGFDMKYASRLFTIFQRLHSNSEFEGSGVGLAICKRILKRHNSKSWMLANWIKELPFILAYQKGAHQ